MDNLDLIGRLENVAVFMDITYLDIKTRYSTQTVIFYDSNFDFSPNLDKMVKFSSSSKQFGWVTQRFKSVKDEYEVSVPSFMAKKIEDLYGFE